MPRNRPRRRRTIAAGAVSSTPAQLPRPARRRMRARPNTAIFSIATGLSRIAGLVARSSPRATSARRGRSRRSRSPSRSRTWCARWWRTRRSPPPSSRSSPSCSSRTQAQGGVRARRRRCSWLILVVLGALTVVFIAVAPWIMPLLHRRQVHARARRPDRRPLPRPVPDRAAARAQRARRRDPQRLRPLHDPRDLARWSGTS